MNKKNIESLGARLEMLGFEQNIRARLAAYGCFDPGAFDIEHRITDAGVQCEFLVHCVKGDLGLYDALYYSGTLRRDIAVPAGLESIDQEMGRVRWRELLEARKGSDDPGIGEMAEKAHKLLSQLGELDATGIIRYRHWVGTPLEGFVPNVALLRSQFEVTQRFYLLQDETPITFRDALRFLQSRWMEKRIVADKKLLLKKRDDTNEGGGTGGGKLLSKRVRANRRPGRHDK